MFKPNSLFYSDGYKPGHKKMLAPGTTRLAGSWIPRTLKYAPKGIEKIASFGHQFQVMWLHDEFKENFFGIPREEAVETYTNDLSSYLGAPFDGSHFGRLWDLGYLPIRYKALPEGIETLPGIPHKTFINTLDGFGWLTLYLETITSELSWKASTSATLGLKYRRNLVKWVMKTDPSNAWFIDFGAHDFSSRGLDPFNSLVSGLGHAISHRGSDSLIVIPGSRYYYGEPKNEVCINSVNASEHSVSTTKIFTVGEQDMVSDWLKIFQTGILSIVADTFDLWKLITVYLVNLKKEILSRDGKLVIRPDSGDPVDIICGVKIPTFYNFAEAEKHFFKNVNGNLLFTLADGYTLNKKYYKVKVHSGNNFDFDEIELKPFEKGVIELLWDIFGGDKNKEGYKVLDPHIGAIYGDSINLDRQVEIYERLEAKGFAATNIVLGVGLT